MARWHRLVAALAAFLAIVGLSLGFSTNAFAFKPPALDGHVLDTASTLSPEQILALDAKLEGFRKRTGFEIVAFVTGSLEGETREDVAYTCFNTWHIGQKGADNGVLLLIAPKERQAFLATGKGVEGALTDLQSSDILEQQVFPALKENRVYDAVDHGTSAIARTLAGDAAASSPRGPRRVRPPAAQPLTTLQIGIVIGVIVFIAFLAAVSSTFRGILWFVVEIFLFRGGRGGGGDGGDGGSGYSGGGGSTGGGGAGGDY